MQATENLVLERTVTLSGVTVPMRLGAQSWGRLNAARDNAVLVCHHYTGIMRAAGRNPDGTPAWWDAMIGPGKAIDTDRYFVVCLNTPGNVQSNDPSVVTTGPDTLAPDGQRWEGRFPAWNFVDLHGLQRELMRDLGVPRWHAVVGPSLGGMQALHWAALTPELAPRVAALITSPRLGPVLRDLFLPLLRDVSQSGGLEGALRLITFFGLGGDGTQHLFHTASFDAYLRARAGTASLAHTLEIGKLVSTYDLQGIAPQSELFANWRKSGLHLLTVNVLGDQFFPAAEMREFARASAGAGVNHTHVEVNSVLGHLAALMETEKFAPHVQALLETPVPEVTHV